MEILKQGKEEKKTLPVIDAYVCPNLHTIVTGIGKEVTGKYATPSQIVCIQCGQVAQSLNFHVNQDLKPSVEWFRPTTEDLQARMLRMGEEEYKRFKHHVDQGMLLSKLIIKTDA